MSTKRQAAAKQSSSHTPTPWRRERLTDHEGAGFKLVSSKNGRQCVAAVLLDDAGASEVEANDAFIVRACNSHDALVASLRAAVAQHQIRCDLAERLGLTPPTQEKWVARARTALAQAQKTP